MISLDVPFDLSYETSSSDALNSQSRASRKTNKVVGVAGHCVSDPRYPELTVRSAVLKYMYLPAG